MLMDIFVASLQGRDKRCVKPHVFFRRAAIVLIIIRVGVPLRWFTMPDLESDRGLEEGVDHETGDVCIFDMGLWASFGSGLTPSG
jgi:hypothetical protein